MAGCCSPAPKSLVIETTVLRVDGATCERCGDTVEAVRSAVEQLKTVLTPLDVRVTLIEHAVSADNLDDSNSVMINGRSLEEWIGAKRVQKSFSVEQVRDAAFAALGFGGAGGCC